MKIIEFEDKYRDDMIFMVLSAKNALGRVPRLNPELLDIKSNYFDKGHPFWLAIDEFDRVIGCIGTRSDDDGKIFLSHLYIKYDLKRHGIGSKLLELAENFRYNFLYITIFCTSNIFSFLHLFYFFYIVLNILVILKYLLEKHQRFLMLGQLNMVYICLIFVLLLV